MFPSHDLNGVSFQDDYEGPLEQRRTIIYSLDFEMKVSFYGPERKGEIIRQVNTNLFNQDAGLVDSDVFLSNIQITPSPSNVNPDSDYGFNIVYLDSAAP